MMSKSEDLAKILNVFSLFSSPTAPWACCEVIPQMQKCLMTLARHFFFFFFF